MTKNTGKTIYETDSAVGLSKIYFDQDVEIRRIRFCGENILDQSIFEWGVDEPGNALHSHWFTARD